MPGHNNWFDINVDHRPAESATESPFSVTFNHSKPIEVMPFQDAADFTAQKIANDYDNLYVGLSGGLDSEFVANVLFRNKIPFTPIIVAFSYTLEHYFALHWCRKHNIEPVVIDLEINDPVFLPWCTSIALTRKFRFRAALMSAYVSTIVDKQNGHLITGEATIGWRTSTFDEAIGNKFKVSHHQFFVDLLNPDRHPSGFLFYTPELLLSTALNIDTSLEDASSRAKLYENVAYRPKSWPPAMPLSMDVRKLIEHRCGVADLADISMQTWDKEELITMLTTPGQK